MRFADSWRAPPISEPSDVPAKRVPRIGIVIHDFALGGTERIAVRLAAAWVDLGAEVEVFCGSERGPIRELLDPRVTVAVATRPISRGLRSVPKLAAAAARHYARHRVDGLFVPGNYHWPVVAAIAGLTAETRPRIIAQISSALEKDQRGAVRQRLFERRMRGELAGADVVVALAGETADVARRILSRPVETIALPVLADVDDGPRSVPLGPPTILAAGRFVAQKDFVTLVEAFARLDHPTATLVIVGDGPQVRLVRARVKALGIGDRVKLAGYAPDIRPWLDQARLFVLSSRHEGYAAVIVEALAAGRPVVTTDCTPAAAELIDSPEVGMVVPIGDPPALAKAMRAMLDRPAPDPQALARRVDRFRIGPIARAYFDLFELAGC